MSDGSPTRQLLAYRAAKLLKRASRLAGRVISPPAHKLGFEDSVRRAQKRLHARLDNMSLPERVRRGELMIERRVSRLEGLNEMLRTTFGQLDPSDPGDYLEFGVYYGSSLVSAWNAMEALGLDRMRCFGFDSFEGMPQETAAEAGPWLPGQFRSQIEFTWSQLQRAGVDPDRVRLIKGWFSDTLTPATAERYELRKAGVVMIDCDIYSSTRVALEFCETLVDEFAFFLFDDWDAPHLPEGEGERRAFEEFLDRHPRMSAEEMGRYGPTTRVFRVGGG